MKSEAFPAKFLLDLHWLDGSSQVSAALICRDEREKRGEGERKERKKVEEEEQGRKRERERRGDKRRGGERWGEVRRWEGRARKRRKGWIFLTSLGVKNSSSWDNMTTRKIISEFRMITRR